MKINYGQALTGIVIILFLNNKLINKPTKISNNLLYIQQYIKRVNPAGKKLVVIFSSGLVYDSKQEELYFGDKIFLNKIQELFTKKEYSVIAINTPCLANGSKCLEDFNRIALGIVELNPTLIIYKGIDSGLGPEAFGTIMQKEEIPIITIGTRVLINNQAYVGPNNKALGEKAYEGIKDIIKPNQKAIYIETVRLTNGDPLDNGYERIHSIRTLLTNSNVQEQKTLFTNWSRTETYDKLLKELRTDGPVDYIITPSQETAEGAVEAIETAGYNQIKIISLDFTNKTYKLIKEERLYAAVSQNFLSQAEVLSSNVEEKLEGEHLFVGEFITKNKLTEENKNLFW